MSYVSLHKSYSIRINDKMVSNPTLSKSAPKDQNILIVQSMANPG